VDEGVRVGIRIFQTDTTVSPVDLAVAAERLGFESIWFSEHSHIPVSRESPWGGQPDAPPLPEWYWHLLDPFVALAAASSATTEIRLATGVCLPAQHDPIWMAKQVATLDALSGGRVVLGVGYGWNVEEMAHHGVDHRSRRAVFGEKVALMRSLWVDDVASYRGEHVGMAPSWSWPKPVQSPAPPVLLGAGLGPRSLRHLVELCDGWLPNRLHDVSAGVPSVRAALSDAGRDPDAFDFTYFAVDPTRELFAEMRRLGVGRVVFPLEPREPAQVLDDLGRLARVVGREGAP
jgi:probable F420-dependent oxidoreductase